MILQFLFAIFASFGFCIIFHLPKRCMPAAILIGSTGWLLLKILIQAGLAITVATFIASLFVALAGDICSRSLKDAATLFIIPGILPLVPGGGMYYAMLYFIQGDMKMAGEWCSTTFMIAGAIAIALLVMASVIRIIVSIYRKIKKK